MANILIADDDAGSGELLRFILAGMGHQVTVTRDGAEALASARKHPPDLIISDILMPVMDGFDLCRVMRLDEKLMTIPFIFCTATYITAEDEQLAMSLGGSGFIRKATEAATLTSVLEQTIQQNLGEKIPPRLLPEETLPELEILHEKIITRKLAKKSSELLSARTAHQDSLELLEAVFDSALNGIVAMNAEGKIIIWNRAASRMFGYEASEAMGQEMLTLLVPHGYREQVLHGMQHFFATGDGPLLGKMTDLAAMRKDGSTFPIALSVASFRRNNAWYVAATIRDISDRKQAEDKIHTQLSELLRWQTVMLDREERHLQLKQEINDLLRRLDEQPRYPGAAESTTQ